ncbi:MAG TPA: hypothetical protein VKA04_10965 [Pseudodesulfovibrio sp.]|nr:hypothetical protein [Pseudodesulfovibrio sp.]
MTVTIAGIEMTGGTWDCAWDRAAGTRTYTYAALAEPRKVDGGKQVPLADAELALLGLEGFDGELVRTVVHNDGPDGSGPSAQDIGVEQLTELSTAYTAVAQAWMGKTVTSGVG